MNKKIKVGIAGFGKVGRMRKKIIEDNPDLTLKGICDVVPPNQNEDISCKFFTNYIDLLKQDIDAVFDLRM